MSDFFGIGNALIGGAHIYFANARRTGRTTALVESVKDGDRIVFADSREADRVNRLCTKRGKNVECVVATVENIYAIQRRGPSRGRTILDHTWVEQYYLRGLEQARKEIFRIEEMASTTKEPPRISDWKPNSKFFTEGW